MSVDHDTFTPELKPFVFVLLTRPQKDRFPPISVYSNCETALEFIRKSALGPKLYWTRVKDRLLGLK